MILITAPTSKIASQLLTRLLPHDAVRVIARAPDQLPDSVRDHADVVAGSHSDPAVLRQALTGVDTIFWLTPPPSPDTSGITEHYQRFADSLCAAISAEHRPRLVGISTLGRGYSNESGLLGAALSVDAQIAATGVTYRALRMPYFMENLVGQLPALTRAGVLAMPNDIDRVLLTVATRDIAAVAADLLLDKGWDGQGSVPVVGPDDLSPTAMAATISDALGREVTAQHVPAAQYKATLTGHGLSAAYADGLINMATAQDDGIYDADAATASRTPTTFAEWCNDILAPAAREQTS